MFKTQLYLCFSLPSAEGPISTPLWIWVLLILRLTLSTIYGIKVSHTTQVLSITLGVLDLPVEVSLHKTIQQLQSTKELWWSSSLSSKPEIYSRSALLYLFWIIPIMPSSSWLDWARQWLLSHVQLSVTPWTIAPARLLCPRNFLEYQSGFSFPTWGVFSAQELNPYLLHWQEDSLPLSHSTGYCHLKSRYTGSGVSGTLV